MATVVLQSLINSVAIGACIRFHHLTRDSTGCHYRVAHSMTYKPATHKACS